MRRQAVAACSVGGRGVEQAGPRRVWRRRPAADRWAPAPWRPGAPRAVGAAACAQAAGNGARGGRTAIRGAAPGVRLAVEARGGALGCTRGRGRGCGRSEAQAYGGGAAARRREAGGGKTKLGRGFSAPRAFSRDPSFPPRWRRSLSTHPTRNYFCALFFLSQMSFLRSLLSRMF